MNINERIKEVRKALDLTQLEFGNRIGIKRNSVQYPIKIRTNMMVIIIGAINFEYFINSISLKKITYLKFY